VALLAGMAVMAHFGNAVNFANEWDSCAISVAVAWARARHPGRDDPGADYPSAASLWIFPVGDGQPDLFSAEAVAAPTPVQLPAALQHTITCAGSSGLRHQRHQPGAVCNFGASVSPRCWPCPCPRRLLPCNLIEGQRPELSMESQYDKDAGWHCIPTPASVRLVTPNRPSRRSRFFEPRAGARVWCFFNYKKDALARSRAIGPEIVPWRRGRGSWGSALGPGGCGPLRACIGANLVVRNGPVYLQLSCTRCLSHAPAVPARRPNPPQPAGFEAASRCPGGALPERRPPVRVRGWPSSATEGRVWPDRSSQPTPGRSSPGRRTTPSCTSPIFQEQKWGREEAATRVDTAVGCVGNAPLPRPVQGGFA
jgi:hypothetical protein